MQLAGNGRNYLHGVVEPLSKVGMLVFDHLHCKQTTIMNC